MSMLSRFLLLAPIFALSDLAYPTPSGDSCGAAFNDEEKDELALLQSMTRVKPAAVTRDKSAASSHSGCGGVGGDGCNYLSESSWVVSFGRSGSSTLQAMIQQIANEVIPGPEFTLLEPCHVGDTARTLHNCSQEMHLLLKCNFSSVTALNNWGGHWDSVDSCCDEKYSPEIASKRCSDATTRNFKTIHVHDLVQEVIPILDDIPELRIINNVRDPRGTYQSMKKQGWQVEGQMMPNLIDLGFADSHWDYNHSLGEHGENPEHLRYICVSLVNMSTVSHPRIHNVKFEDLMSTLDAATSVISFLQFPVNNDTESIAKENFPGLRPGSEFSHINHYPGDGEETYTSHDGSMQATGQVEWTPRELEVLSSTECQSALALWGYPATSSSTHGACWIWYLPQVFLILAPIFRTLNL